jgi:hypothetical protein
LISAKMRLQSHSDAMGSDESIIISNWQRIQLNANFVTDERCKEVSTAPVERAHFTTWN